MGCFPTLTRFSVSATIVQATRQPCTWSNAYE
jgi:hypothetical protein